MSEVDQVHVPLSVTYPKIGSSEKVTGSYAGKTLKATFVVNVPYTKMISTCQSPTGLESLVFTRRFHALT